MDSRTLVIDAFEHVRAIPYATDAASDAPSLRALGRGNCVAKAQQLADEVATLGHATRLVSWEYELPELLEFQRELSFRTDIHTATQVMTGGTWLLVDATHDPPPRALGLTVGGWDGLTSTAPAYAPIGPIWVEDEEQPDREETLARITQGIEATPPDLVARYLAEFNWLLERTRS